MKALRQSSPLGLVTLFTSLALVAGCAGIMGDPDDDKQRGDGDSAGDGDGDGDLSGDGDGDIYANPSECKPGIPSTSQVPRLLNREYDAIIHDLLGVTALASEGGLPPSSSLNPDFDGAMNTYAWNAYVLTAQAVAAEVMGGPNKSNFINCDAADPACLQSTIRAFGRKAFRRPVTDEEVTSFMRLNSIEPAGTPDEVAEALLFAFLASPSFLMRLELNQQAEGQALQLSAHEVASRLSFLLWGSVPDDILNLAADNDQLQTKEQILAQAERMIENRAKTAPLVAQGHRAYLGMDGTVPHWWNRTHDTEKFPLYSDDTKPVMEAELDSFFEEIAFGGGSFRDIFLSPVAFVNQLTAPLYGLNAADYGPELTRVELDPEERPGFLTRLGFLSSFSRYETTSPILRGAFMTVRLIGVDPGPPVPGVEDTPRPTGDFATERELVDELTSPNDCSNCHQRVINPPGYVLEWFDAVGSRQTVDPLGGPINGTAEVIFGPDNAKTISSPVELMAEIAQGDLAKRMYAEHLVSFGFKRRPNSNDACVVDELGVKLSADGYTVLDLLADLTQADSFRLRTVASN